jgi:hypothetical protein
MTQRGTIRIMYCMAPRDPSHHLACLVLVASGINIMWELALARLFAPADGIFLCLENDTNIKPNLRSSWAEYKLDLGAQRFSKSNLV